MLDSQPGHLIRFRARTERQRQDFLLLHADRRLPAPELLLRRPHLVPHREHLQHAFRQHRRSHRVQLRIGAGHECQPAVHEGCSTRLM